MWRRASCAYSRGAGRRASAPTELAAMTPLQGPARSRGTGGFVTWLPGAAHRRGRLHRRADGQSFARHARHARSGGGRGQAVRQTLAGFGVGGLPRDLGSTGFAAVDANGQAASCAVTMNGPFGSGRTAAGTGVVLAQTPSSTAGLASAFLTPVIATQRRAGRPGRRRRGRSQRHGGGALCGAGSGGGRPLGQARRSARHRRGAVRHGQHDFLRQDACVALTDPGAHGAGVAADECVATQ